jgi:hypothetical protein
LSLAFVRLLFESNANTRQLFLAALGRIPAPLSPGLVRLSSDRTGFRFDARYLTLASRRDEQSMTVMLKRELPMTVLKYRRDRLLAQRACERLKRGPHLAASPANELHLSI